MVKNKGFSLIELLVALAIMSFTLIIMTQGYSFFMQRWNKELGNFDLALKNTKSLITTKRLVEGIYPFIVRDTDQSPVIFFEGDEEGLVAVTTRSLFSGDLPTIFRLSINQAEDFSYQLIYEEHPAKVDEAFTRLSQPRLFSKKVVLIESLDFVQFSYFGFENIDEKNNVSSKQWWRSFNALSRNIMPERLSIKYGILGEEHSLQIRLTEFDSRVMVQFSESF